ncbi:MAG: hypothetical protein ACRDUY_15155 [Nitriliruptorales bacterium]
MGRVVLALLTLVLVLVACGNERSVQLEDPAAAGGEADSEEVAWEHLARVEGQLPGAEMGAALNDQLALSDAWEQYGFEGSPPDVDFATSFVLLLAQPDDACPDELVRLEVVDGTLEVAWLPPPGGCDQPLIFRVHAVRVHRGQLPSRFTVPVPQYYEGDLHEVSLELPAFDGTAPPPPEPPRAMTEAELDAVFQGHAVQRCTADDELVGRGEVDGPLSDDPEVAEAQQARADFGVPSDEATTRRAMAEPRGEGADHAAPLFPEEVAAEEERSRLSNRVMEWLVANGWDPEREVVGIIDRRGDGRFHVRVDADRAEELQRELDREFGVGVVGVDANPYPLAAIAEAQRAVARLAGAEGPGAIVSITGIPGPVEVGMVDPTREALDRIAETVDPALVCVAPALSGVEAATAD